MVINSMRKGTEIRKRERSIILTKHGVLPIALVKEIRYAGPNEAILRAIMRKNFGC